MSHDNDGVVLLQIFHQLFNFVGRNRVKCRSRLIHQDHIGFHGDGARDTKTLLLAT
ncbi:Uncharacterised protein [Vibrio cholerae]|nr:Uncharacterised protein [Vibrio cholerae]